MAIHEPKDCPTETLKAAEAIHAADALLITAGAGMGVDSGLPDFRGKEGFWRAYPAIAQRGIAFEEMANPDWFHRDPKLAWAFYGHRLNLYRDTKPHAGFQQLLNLGNHKPGGYFVVTSNVDGQFQQAGFAESNLEECHGSIHHFQCTQGCGAEIWDGNNLEVQVDEHAFQAIGNLPNCAMCGAIARPNILMFNDWGWDGIRTQDQENRLERWLKGLTISHKRLTILEIGAGLSVPTIRMRSERYATLFDAVLVRINPRDYHVPSKKHVAVKAGGLAGINSIMQALPQS